MSKRLSAFFGVVISITLLLQPSASTRAASIENGDVTTSLAGNLFVDDAVTGGSDVTTNDDSSPRTIGPRFWDLNSNGAIDDVGLEGTLTIDGFGFASSGTASANDATSIDLTFVYLGEDEVTSVDDVILGTRTVDYNHVGAGEYFVNFDSPISSLIDGLGQAFNVLVTANDLDGALQESIRFKSAALQFETFNGPKLSVSGSFVTSAVDWLLNGSGQWSAAGNWSSNPGVPGVGGLSGGTARLGNVISGPESVNLDVNVNLANLVFDNENSYTLTDNGGANTLTLSGDAVLSASNGEHVIDVTIAGSSGLNKVGPGTVSLSGNNTYSGTNILGGGTLAVTTNANLGNAANGIELNGGALRVDGTTLSTLSRSVAVVDGGTLNVDDASHTVNVTGSVTGTGNFVKAGDGGAKLSNAATFDGGISVNGGTLVVDSSSGLGSTTGITQVGAAGGTVELDGSGGSLTINENFERLLARFGGVPEAHIRNTAGNNTIAGTIEAGGGAFGSARLENTAEGSTLTINNTISYVNEDTSYNIVFQGTGDFQVGNAATPGSGKIVGSAVNVIVQLDDATDKVTIATGEASGDSSNATGSYWGGNTTIESGTLEVLDGTIANNGELISRRIAVQEGATFDVSAFSTYNSQITDLGVDATAFTPDDIGQIFAGGGAINTGSGQIVVFEDSRVAPGDDGAGTLNVNGNLRFNLTQGNLNGGLDYDLGSTTTVGSGVNDLLAASGSLDLDQTGTGQFNLNITPSDGALAAGTYTLMTGSTAGSTATGSDFAITLVNSQGTVLNSRQDDSSSVSVNGSSVTVNFTAAQTSNWTGSTDGTWDVGTSSNWSSTDGRFLDLDTVTFADGTGQTAVNIVGPVTPGGVTFANSSDTYTVTGDSVQGSGALTLAVGAKVVLANTANGFTGGTNIGAGATLTLGDGSSNNGALAENSAVANQGSLAFNRTGYGFFNQAISGSGVVEVNSGFVDFSAINTYSGGSTVNGGTMRLRNPSAAGTGSITVNNGAVVATGYFNNQSFSKSVTLNNGSSLSVTNPDDSGVGPAGSGQITWTNPITIGGTGGRVNTTAGDGTVPGMTVAGGITGVGDLTLSADVDRLLVVNSALTHSGNTAISDGGTVALQGSSSISSPVIAIENNSTLDVSGKTSGTLALSGQSLRGVGTVVGNVTTASSSTIRVGGIAGGVPSVTTGLQLNYDAGLDTSGDATWDDASATAGNINLNFANGSASTVAVNDPNFPALTAAYDIGTTGGAIVPGANNTYFDGRATSSGTFEIVFNVTNTSAGNEQVLMDIGGGRGVAITLDGSTLTAGVNGDATDTTSFNTNLSSGWHHAVVVIGDTEPADGSDDEFTLYIDNAVVGTSNTVDIDDYSGGNGWGFGGPASVTLDPTQLGAGAPTLAAPIEFHGQIAIARYYQTAFDANDVGTNFAALQADSPFVGVDTLTVAGDLTLDASSIVELDIFDTTIGSDLLSVEGLLTADGILDISLAGTVGLGDTFDILDFGSITGSFDDVNLPALDGGLGWDISSLLSTGELTVVTGADVDIDNDGDVDGSDFLSLQRTNPALIPAWETQYGSGIPLSAASTSVPEPSSLLLLAVSGLGLLHVRRFKIS